MMPANRNTEKPACGAALSAVIRVGIAASIGCADAVGSGMGSPPSSIASRWCQYISNDRNMDARGEFRIDRNTEKPVRRLAFSMVIGYSLHIILG